MGHPGYDGIHMRGPLAEQHYTKSVLRIFQDLVPKLNDKEIPKITKPSSYKPEIPKITKPSPYKPVNNRQQQYSHSYTHSRPDWREPRPAYNYRRDEHLDCEQARYQRAQRYTAPAGFRIPTQNRFNPFYNIQGNF